MNKTLLSLGLLLSFLMINSRVVAADIPQSVAYTRIYDFLDELAIDGLIEINSVVKPYSREFIAQRLSEVDSTQLNRRQHKELLFFLNEYALELGKLPQTKVSYVNKRLSIALIQPAFHYRDSLFSGRITPILGAEFSYNKNKFVPSRYFGAEIQATIGKYFSVWGSIRDKAMRGELLSQPSYLNDLPGYQYKETADGKGGDYSDSRGGIKFANRWLSIGLQKENIIWGDNYHGSNILSGRAPSFPMITLQVKPVKWFQLDYFHAWLVSNEIDSTHYYLENGSNKHFRPANKFMAANMLTFTPIKRLNISIGNSIIYSENSVQAAYFIPIAFYKSLDHLLTKGTRTENQNSQFYFNISSRNIKHLHLYASVFVDELSFPRFKPSNRETNPISYKVGAKLSNFPLQNFSLLAEYTRNNIITYKHSISVLNYTSNSYNLGNYLGDNSQEIYLQLTYKPIRGLDLSLSYLYSQHGNEYEYLRRDENGVAQILNIISQDFMQDVVWTNSTIEFRTLYELINNFYLGLNLQYSDMRSDMPTSTAIPGEIRPDNGAQGYLDMYTPEFLQGKTFTLNMMLNIGF